MTGTHLEWVGILRRSSSRIDRLKKSSAFYRAAPPTSRLATTFRLIRRGILTQADVSISPRQARGVRCGDPDPCLVSHLNDIVNGDDPELLIGTTALAVVFSSVGDVFGFWLFINGELVRNAVFKSGDSVVDHGEPLPIETRLTVPSWGHDEDYLWPIIESIIGVTPDLDAQFEIYKVDT